MTDADPYAQYLKPSSGAPSVAVSPDTDPYAQYLKPSGGAALPATSAPIAKTAPSTVGGYIMNLLTKPATPGTGLGASVDEGVIPALRDYGLSALDAASFGYLPGKMGMGPAVAQAHHNLGPIMDPIAQGIGYAAGPGKIIGPLARGAAGLGGLTGVGGSMTAAGLEGATAGGLGAAGHGGGTGDIVQGALVGGGTGALAGALGGSGPKPKVPELGTKAGMDPTGVPIPATGMYAAREKAYAPLDQNYFNTHGDALNRAQNVIQQNRNPLGRPVPVSIPSDVQAILTDPNGLANPEVTGRTIQEASRALRKTNDWTGNRYADALDNVLRYDTPVAGGVAGAAGEAKAAGDLIHGRVRGLERLQDPTQANIAKTQSYYDKGSPEYQTLDALQQPPSTVLPFLAKHVAAPAVGAAIGGTAGYLTSGEGGPSWPSTLQDALVGAMIGKGTGAISAARSGAALNAARRAIATGQPDMTPTGYIGNALLKLMAGRVAGNQPQ